MFLLAHMLTLDQGFGLGPVIWGPLSEAFGRTIPLFSGYFVFCIMQIPIAVAQNLQTVMLIRFLGGISGSAVLAIIGGVLADVYGRLVDHFRRDRESPA